MAQGQGNRTRVLTQAELDQWPLYASIGEWAKALNMYPLTLRNAEIEGRLKGDINGTRRHFSKRQILKWYAPAIYEEVYGNLTASK